MTVMVEIKKSVQGLPHRQNDVVVVADRSPDNGATGVVVYFGGDVQDLEESMLANADSNFYVQWSLEAMAKLLAEAMPDHAVVVVRPDKYDRGTISRFDNFVETAPDSVPVHDPDHGGLRHLRLLLQNLGFRNVFPKRLVGFSKGAVVLNQLLYEMAHPDAYLADEDETFAKFIRKMCWMDGGHSGKKDTWVNDCRVLKNFFGDWENIQVDIRLTPYQVEDPLRPWIKKEERLFSDSVPFGGGVSHRRKVYFAWEAPSLENHFKLLSTLKDEPL